MWIGEFKFHLTIVKRGKQIMRDRKRVCPVERAGGLDFRLRKFAHNPKKILGEYVVEDMVVLDVGCGPGFFSIEIAKMVGENGKVIAADLQEGMLDKLRKKIEGNEIARRIQLHKCEANRIGVTEKVDFVLAFYMVHEVPDPMHFLKEIRSILRPNGHLLISEPKFHVKKEEFKETISHAASIGLKPFKEKKIFLSRTMVFRNNSHGPLPIDDG
jgi:ubiquinone/menaquinone biosynthesis C-methylase UbiE